MGQARGNRQKRIATALGASRVIKISTRKAKGPLGWLWLAQAVQNRLISSGGRPSDPSWDTKRLVPFSKRTWRHLADEAKAISARGRKVGPAQLAAILIEGSLVSSEAVSPAENIHINIHAAGLEVQQAFGNFGGEPTALQPLRLSLPAVHATVGQAVPSRWAPENAPDDLVRSRSIGV